MKESLITDEPKMADLFSLRCFKFTFSLEVVVASVIRPTNLAAYASSRQAVRTLAKVNSNLPSNMLVATTFTTCRAMLNNTFQFATINIAGEVEIKCCPSYSTLSLKYGNHWHGL